VFQAEIQFHSPQGGEDVFGEEVAQTLAGQCLDQPADDAHAHAVAPDLTGLMDERERGELATPIYTVAFGSRVPAPSRTVPAISPVAAVCARAQAAVKTTPPSAPPTCSSSASLR
jgi:hypothetical protein